MTRYLHLTRSILAAVLTEQRKQSARNRWNGKIDPSYLETIFESLKDNKEYVDWAISQIIPLLEKGATKEELRRNVQVSVQNVLDSLKTSQPFTTDTTSTPEQRFEKTEKLFIDWNNSSLSKALRKVHQKIDWFERFKQTKDPRVMNKVKNQIKTPTDIKMWKTTQIDQLMNRYPELKSPSELITKHPEVAQVVYTEQTDTGDWEVILISGENVKADAKVIATDIRDRVMTIKDAYRDIDVSTPQFNQANFDIAGKILIEQAGNIVVIGYKRGEDGYSEYLVQRAKEIMGQWVKPSADQGLCIVKLGNSERTGYDLAYYLVPPVWADYLKAVCMYGGGTEWCTTDWYMGNRYLQVSDIYLFLKDHVVIAQQEIQKGKQKQFLKPDRSSVKSSDEVYQIYKNFKNSIQSTTDTRKKFSYEELNELIEENYNIESITDEISSNHEPEIELEYWSDWMRNLSHDEIHEPPDTMYGLYKSNYLSQYLQEHPKDVEFRIFGMTRHLTLDQHEVMDFYDGAIHKSTQDKIDQMLDWAVRDYAVLQRTPPTAEQISSEKHKANQEFLEKGTEAAQWIEEDLRNDLEEQKRLYEEYDEAEWEARSEAAGKANMDYDYLISSGTEDDDPRERYLDQARHMEDNDDYGDAFAGLTELIETYINETYMEDEEEN